MFITFEGGEGCGKTTQIKLLDEYLKKQGHKTVLTREPGGTDISEKIRAILLDPDNKNMHSRTELLLFAAARAQHVEELIRPSLREGKTVICDRFYDSTTAYQQYGRNLDDDMVQALIEVAVEGLHPDLTILLDIDPAIGISRALDATEEKERRFDSEELDFHKRLRDGFLQIAENNPKRVKVIYADRPIEEVHKDIVKMVEEMLVKR